MLGKRTADACLLKGVQDVLLAADFGQERATGNNMDSCAFGAQAAEESGHRNKHQCLCRYVLLLFSPTPITTTVFKAVHT